MELAFVGLVLTLSYFAPSVVAVLRKHHNLPALIALNVLLGWTLLGWVGAFVWAFTRPPQPTIVTTAN